MVTSVDITTGRPFDSSRPSPRIYIQGYQYKLVAPYIVKPPLVDTLKLIWNWVGPAARIAKNVMYAHLSGSPNTSDASVQLNVANALMDAINSANLNVSISHDWVLQSVTARDNGLGTDAQTDSNVPPITGAASVDPYPPQVTVVISWGTSVGYRGGKPRTYLPGIPQGVVTTPGGSQLTPGYAAGIATEATNLLTQFNATVLASGPITLGTISYQKNHAALATPIFRPFPPPAVHERLDSQRRRSGKEESFPEVAPTP